METYEIIKVTTTILWSHYRLYNKYIFSVVIVCSWKTYVEQAKLILIANLTIFTDVASKIYMVMDYWLYENNSKTDNEKLKVIWRRNHFYFSRFLNIYESSTT